MSQYVPVFIRFALVRCNHVEPNKQTNNKTPQDQKMNQPNYFSPLSESAYSGLSSYMTRSLSNVYLNRRAQQECEKAAEDVRREKELKEQFLKTFESKTV